MNELSNRLDMDFEHYKLSGTTSDDYYTPPFIFEALSLTFDLDVCAPVGGVPWIPAKRSLSMIDDGLTQDWGGALVWMNPPYSNPLPWTRKFMKHNNGIAFVPTSSGKWMLELWQSQCVWLATPPVRFYTANLIPAKGTMPGRCWLVAAGEIGIQALLNSGLGKVRL